VPSKAVIRSARAAHDVRTAGAFGVRTAGDVRVDFAAAMARMRELRSRIAPHDSAARMKELGVDVYLGAGRFVAPDALEVDGRRLPFARAVIATGARAAAPPIPGLADVGFLTNETVFSVTELPRRLLVIGAGPIGCELAQAFRRLGSEVTIVAQGDRLLPREDPDAAAILRAAFEAEGIRLALGARIVAAERHGLGKTIVFERGGGREVAAGDEILVAVGRAPNVETLDVAAAGVALDKGRVKVDDRLRTTNRRIYAAGDVCSPYQFTHAADAMARVVLANALFFGRRKASSLVIPWCTYTDPEVAHVGLYEGDVTFTVPLADVDRAIVDGETDGFARIHADRKGRILGATLVSRHAGESIGEIALAMTHGLRISALGETVHPYPTQAEVWKRLGDASQRARLTPGVRGFLARILRWRRR
jgi:pyruvate/2-oxoglutarate dehydrogenase complex dihydrolipoamide dehydrogenase (E3) component